MKVGQIQIADLRCALRGIIRECYTESKGIFNNSTIQEPAKLKIGGLVFSADNLCRSGASQLHKVEPYVGRKP